MTRTSAVLAAAATAFALLAVPSVSAATRSEAAASAIVAKTVDEVLAILSDDDLSLAQRIRSIEQIVDGRFDLRTMSRLVLARNWKRFSREQQVEYVDEFKKYLSNNYGHRIERYNQQTVEILGARDEARGDVIVRTRIEGGEFAGARVDYRLRNVDLEWRVIDVVIEGISMVSNFSDQFREVVSRGGPEELLQRLRQKNQEASVRRENQEVGTALVSQ